jgi:hypothetical protein
MANKEKLQFSVVSGLSARCVRGYVSAGGGCEACDDSDFVICDGSTWWCEACWEANGEPPIPKEIIKQVLEARAKQLQDKAEKLLRRAKG